MFPFDFCGTRAHHLWRAHSSAQHLTTFALCLCVWGGRPYDALSLSFALYPQAEIHSRDGMQVCKEASGQAQQLCQAKRHLSLWCRLFRAAQPTRYNLSRFAGVTPVGCHDATTFSHARTHARTHTHTLSLSHSITHTHTLSLSHSLSHSLTQSINQSINQSIEQSINRAITLSLCFSFAPLHGECSTAAA